MSKLKMFRLKISDGEVKIGTVYSVNEPMLRALGAAYIRNQSTKGMVTLYRANHEKIAAFNIWTDRWDDADTSPS